MDSINSPEIDWDEVYEEALQLLVKLIRFNTVNPPGNEKEAAQWIAGIFRDEGIETKIIHSSSNRANVIGRLRGTGEKEPLLLHGHLDVVPVELDKWSVDPFEGVIKDGCLWGRGAVDMKNMVIMCVMTMVLMKRHGIMPKRDIIFAGVADEEAGGEFGAEYLVNNFPDEVRAEYALGEMGGFSVEMSGKRFYLIQVAEKGVCWFKVKTHGEPGHGSIPDRHSALVQATHAATLLAEKGLPHHNTDAATRFIRGLADSVGVPKGILLKLLLRPTFAPMIISALSKGDDRSVGQVFNAVLHNTANPTMIRSGEKVNVIGSEAELECDGRMLPGQSVEDFLAEVRNLIGGDVDIDVMCAKQGAQAPADDPIMDVMSQSILRHDPDGIVIPNLLTGFTDAAHWSKLGTKCYGFSPLRMPADMKFKELVHGHDERVPLNGFKFGLQVLFEAVHELVTV